MTPGAAPYDIPDRRRFDAILLGQPCLQFACKRLLANSTSDGKDIRSDQASHGVLFPAQHTLRMPMWATTLAPIAVRESTSRTSVTGSGTPLLYHVSTICQVSTRKKMVRVTAARPIATMAHAQTKRYRAVGENVAESMGVDKPVVYGKLAVPSSVLASKPLPTLGRRLLVHIGPKPCDVFWGILRVHRKPRPFGVMPPAATNSAVVFLGHLYCSTQIAIS